MGTTEVRGFGDIKKIFEERKWSQPIKIDLEEEINAVDLAGKLDIPVDRIEIVFVNGKAGPFNADCLIKPGDRVAYVPPGTPGPYRVLLGFKNEDKK